MNIDERIKDYAYGDNHRYSCICQGEGQDCCLDQDKEFINELIRDVLEEVKPKGGELYTVPLEGEDKANAEGHNQALRNMEDRIKSLGL